MRKAPPTKSSIPWPLVYGAVLTWLVLLIVLMRLFTERYG
jgi:hypothetical protein